MPKYQIWCESDVPYAQDHIYRFDLYGRYLTFHVLKTPVNRFDLYGRYRTLYTNDDNFWYCCLELAYIDLYRRYQTLWTDDDNFW